MHTDMAQTRQKARTAAGSDRRRMAAAQRESSPLLAPPDALEKKLIYFAYPLLLCLVLFFLSVHPLIDPDAWLHMALGRYALEHHALPHQDLFSFTSQGHAWISSGWAASVLMQVVYGALGAAGLVYGVFLLMIAVYLGAYFCAVRSFSNRGSAVLVLMVCALGSCLRFTPRPEVFSQLFLAATMLLLLSSSRLLAQHKPSFPRRLWLLPAVFFLWANFHAGFPAGLAMVGLCTLWFALNWRTSRHGRPWLLAALAGAACFATWVANPYGVNIALLSARIKELPGLRQSIYEWMPMFGPSGANLPWVVIGALALLLCLWIWTSLCQRKQHRLWQSAAALIFTALALYELRHSALCALGLALLSLAQLQPLEALLARRRALLPAAACGLAAAICFAQFQGLTHFGQGLPSARLDDTLLPVTATQFAKANPLPSNMYNTYGPGGYLLYQLGPQTKVFMDGRNDVYTPKVWQDHWDIQNGVISLDEAVSRYGLNTFFIYCRENTANPQNLANRLTAHHDWRLVYFDDSYAIYVRQSPQTTDYLKGREFRYVSPFALELLHNALLRPETRQEARDEIQRALKLSGGSAKANLLAAFASRTLGDSPAEQRYQQAAAKRDPGAGIGQSPE